MASDTRKWLALALLCGVQFMVVLDITIVNVALPSIQSALGFTRPSLQWVISAYALAFAGFLLLGGRAADVLGRRRVFVAGLVLFTTGSLAAGLASSQAALIAARALQGLGAALITPAALAILSTTFGEGRDRNVALGIWGAVGGFGAAAGVLTGGLLTDVLSWEWIFFVNVPFGVVAAAVAPILLRESRSVGVKGFDVVGAVTVTAGLSSLVYAITATATIAFAVSGVLLAAFVGWELRHDDPLMRFGLLRIRTVTGANVAGLITGMATFSVFVLLTLYMQEVLGYSALQTGLAYLTVAGTRIVWAAVASRLVTRVGVKPVLVLGMAALAAGLLTFTQLSVEGSYAADLLPGLLLVALGMGFTFVPISVAALDGVAAREAGVASGLINTSQQVGCAVGIAVLTAIATAGAGGDAQAPELVSGFHDAFAAGAVIALVGLLAVLVLIRRDERHLAEVIELRPREVALDLAA